MLMMSPSGGSFSVAAASEMVTTPVTIIPA